MANRVLIGNRATGGYGLYVSRLTSNVLDCANDKLMFNTNSGESGSNFFSAGHFQTVPASGGTGTNAPVTSQTTTIAASGTGTPTYVGRTTSDTCGVQAGTFAQTLTVFNYQQGNFNNIGFYRNFSSG